MWENRGGPGGLGGYNSLVPVLRWTVHGAEGSLDHNLEVPSLEDGEVLTLLPLMYLSSSVVVYFLFYLLYIM